MASERDESREGATSQCEDGEKDGNNAVVDDAVASPEMLIKHPLQNRWSLWFFKNDKNRDWTENQRCITSFDTVEDFWGLYNHVQKASKLPPGCDYSMFKLLKPAIISGGNITFKLFDEKNASARLTIKHQHGKEGIQPAWEDSRNKNGGRWLISLNKQQRHTDLDNFWLETLLCLIGEAFDEQSDDVCGAVVNIRGKGDKLALWTVDANRAESNTKIGKKLKERLNIPAKFPIGFQAHQDTISKTGSTAKNRFTV